MTAQQFCKQARLHFIDVWVNVQTLSDHFNQQGDVKLNLRFA